MKRGAVLATFGHCYHSLGSLILRRTQPRAANVPSVLLSIRKLQDDPIKLDITANGWFSVAPLGRAERKCETSKEARVWRGGRLAV